jgi:hypothetical protein
LRDDGGCTLWIMGIEHLTWLAVTWALQESQAPRRTMSTCDAGRQAVLLAYYFPRALTWTRPNTTSYGPL